MRVEPWLTALFFSPRRRSPRKGRRLERLEDRIAPGDIAFAFVGASTLPGLLVPPDEGRDGG